MLLELRFLIQPTPAWIAFSILKAIYSELDERSGNATTCQTEVISPPLFPEYHYHSNCVQWCSGGRCMPYLGHNDHFVCGHVGE